MDDDKGRTHRLRQRFDGDCYVAGVDLFKQERRCMTWWIRDYEDLPLQISIPLEWLPDDEFVWARLPESTIIGQESERFLAFKAYYDRLRGEDCRQFVGMLFSKEGVPNPAGYAALSDMERSLQERILELREMLVNVAEEIREFYEAANYADYNEDGQYAGDEDVDELKERAAWIAIRYDRGTSRLRTLKSVLDHFRLFGSPPPMKEEYWGDPSDFFTAGHIVEPAELLKYLPRRKVEDAQRNRQIVSEMEELTRSGEKVEAAAVLVADRHGLSSSQVADIFYQFRKKPENTRKKRE